jgi:hypothetical protein
MENKLGFLGKHNETSVYLNMGKYGYYLNFDDKLYSVPACFQTDKFNLEAAIKFIEYKSKLIKEEEKLKTESSIEDIISEINTATDIIELKMLFRNLKNFKKRLINSNIYIYMNNYPESGFQI